MKKIAVLGSTGSIGTQTLDVIRRNSEFQIVALAAGSNIDLLEAQIREFHPLMACLWEESAALELKGRLSDCQVRIVCGMDGLLEIAVMPEAQVLVSAIVGMIGIRPTIAAIEAGKTIALANKETLVCAGHIIMPLAEKYHVDIIPIDSEHSAIFQCLNGEPKDKVSKILLTASGGPFRGRTRRELEHVSVEEALHHPNWSMGKKVTIDSSTLVNKGLEIMEAKWLFGVDISRIQVVIHPQSIIHSMVEYVDGSIIAQMAVPDMRLPIQYALTYPDRYAMPDRKVDFAKLGSLTFEEPDTDTFKGLKLAYRAADTGGSMPTVYNAANERAVSLFLDHRIGYLQIAELIEAAMDHFKVIPDPDVDGIFMVEQQVHEFIDQEVRACQ